MIRKIVLLLVVSLSLEIGHVHSEIQDLDNLLMDYFETALDETIESIDLSTLTVEFVSKVKYEPPEVIREDITDTVSEDYENNSDEEESHTFEKTYDFENQMTWIIEDGLLASTLPTITSSYTGKKGFDVNAIITDDEQCEQEKSATKTLTKKSVVKVPAHKKVTASWDIVEKETEIAWEVELAISGSVGLTCSEQCGDPLTIGFLIEKDAVLDDFFTIDGDKLKFTARGQLNTILGYSSVVKFETEDNSEETLEAEDEPSEDDLAAADEDPTLSVVKNVLTIASDNIDPDSEWQPWIQMAGGIADIASGDVTNVDAWNDVISSAQDIIDSPLGQSAIEKLKNLTSKVRNKSKEKSEQINKKCKGNRRRNNGNECPSRRRDVTRPPITRSPNRRPRTRQPSNQNQVPGGPTRRPSRRTRAPTGPNQGPSGQTRRPSRPNDGPARATRAPTPRRTPAPRHTPAPRRTPAPRQPTKPKPKPTNRRRSG